MNKQYLRQESSAISLDADSIVNSSANLTSYQNTALQSNQLNPQRFQGPNPMAAMPGA